MGLFSSKSKTAPDPEKTCALCDRILKTNEEKDVGLCVGHALILESDIKVASSIINEYQPKANAEKDPDTRIQYLRMILDQLYKIQIKYYENGIEPLTGDIDEMIDNIIECISTARL